MLICIFFFSVIDHGRQPPYLEAYQVKTKYYLKDLYMIKAKLLQEHINKQHI